MEEITMGGKSRKTGGVSKKLVRRLMQQQKKNEMSFRRRPRPQRRRSVKKYNQKGQLALFPEFEK
jgi:hypothetical protein